MDLTSPTTKQFVDHLVRMQDAAFAGDWTSGGYAYAAAHAEASFLASQGRFREALAVPIPSDFCPYCATITHGENCRNCGAGRKA